MACNSDNDDNNRSMADENAVGQMVSAGLSILYKTNIV